MCRLFGFRSVIESQVHRSLTLADNALGAQSRVHPDGWGVAYYVAGTPQIIKSAASAFEDALFQRVSGVVASQTVLAHVRRATVGALSVLNSHPFQHGRWVFAHNGDIAAFERHREALRQDVAPMLRRYILGDTDSEVLFFLMLSELARSAPLDAPRSLRDLATAAQRTVAAVRARCDIGAAKPSTLTFLITDGASMLAHQGGKELYFSTYKTACGERDRCAARRDECEQPTSTGHVRHFLASSEPLLGENIWLELELGEAIGVDAELRLAHFGPDGETPTPHRHRSSVNDPVPLGVKRV